MLCMNSHKSFDVCIVGGGVSGALLATRLIESGKRVCIVESGPKHKSPGQRYGYFLNHMADYLSGPWAREMDRFEHQYEFSGDMRGAQVERAVGGSTLAWDGLVLRMHKTEFEPIEIDGEYYEWPFSYDEIEPYYCSAEKYLGVSATNDVPYAKRSILPPNPPFPFSYADKKYFIPACKKNKINYCHTSEAKNSQPFDGRSACQQFKKCEACPIGAKYSADVHLNRLLDNENFTLLNYHDVLNINSDKFKVTGVTVKKRDGKTFTIASEVVAVCANGVENATLLLNSKNKYFPKGLSNSSELIGKYFYSTLSGSHAKASVLDSKLKSNTGFATAHSQQFITDRNSQSEAGFLLTFSANIDGMFSAGNVDTLSLGNDFEDSYFPKFKDMKNRKVILGVHVKNEILPRYQNQITLTSKKDIIKRFKPKLTLNLSSYERNGIERGLKKSELLLRSIPEVNDIEILSTPRIINAHLKGTVRMGKSSKCSVVDSYCKSHEMENLFVIGASSFVRGGLNPTLTVAAISLRSFENINSIL